MKLTHTWRETTQQKLEVQLISGVDANEKKEKKIKSGHKKREREEGETTKDKYKSKFNSLTGLSSLNITANNRINTRAVDFDIVYLKDKEIHSK
jgi:hypothetical protein